MTIYRHKCTIPVSLSELVDAPVMAVVGEPACGVVDDIAVSVAVCTSFTIHLFAKLYILL